MVSLIIIFPLSSFINHIYKPIVALTASWVFSHISEHGQKLQTRAALLGSLIFLRSLKVLTAYGLSKASASASKSIYLQLLKGVKWHRTLFLWEGIIFPEVRNGEQKTNYSWRSDDWFSFELLNNHLCHTGCFCKESLFWNRVDYLPCCFARQFKLSDASRPNPEVLPPHSIQWEQWKQLKDGRSRPVLLGLYTFSLIVLTLFFSYLHQLCTVGTSEWRVIKREFISQDCRKWCFPGLQKKGSSYKNPSWHTVLRALFAYKSIVSRRNWKMMAIYPFLSLPPVVPLLAKQLKSLHCFKFNACRWFYLEFVLLVRHASSVY